MISHRVELEPNFSSVHSMNSLQSGFSKEQLIYFTAAFTTSQGSSPPKRMGVVSGHQPANDGFFVALSAHWPGPATLICITTSSIINHRIKRYENSLLSSGPAAVAGRERSWMENFRLRSRVIFLFSSQKGKAG